MRFKELRLDNIVLFEGKEMFVEELTKRSLDLSFRKGDGVYCITYDDKELKPLPFNKEILLKFGFEDKRLHYYLSTPAMKELVSDDITFVSIKGELYLSIGDNTISYGKIPVHTFQNLYFALTGEEIIVNQ